MSEQPRPVVIIGGRSIEIPKLNIKTLKRVFPLIKKMQGDDDLDEMVQMDIVGQFFSFALERSASPMTVDEIEDALLVQETPGLKAAIDAILVDNELAGGRDQTDPPPAEARPSTETLTP